MIRFFSLLGMFLTCAPKNKLNYDPQKISNPSTEGVSQTLSTWVNKDSSVSEQGGRQFWIFGRRTEKQVETIEPYLSEKLIPGFAYLFSRAGCSYKKKPNGKPEFQTDANINMCRSAYHDFESQPKQEFITALEQFKKQIKGQSNPNTGVFGSSTPSYYAETHVCAQLYDTKLEGEARQNANLDPIYSVFFL